MKKFCLSEKVCVITGGAGLMGDSHARAILSGGGVVVLLDISDEKLNTEKTRLQQTFSSAQIETYLADITNRNRLEVPNLDDPLLRIWDVPAYEKFYYHEAHLSCFTEESLKILLEKCGFIIESM